WHSLLPSKVWLTAVDSPIPEADPAAIVAQIKAVKQAWSAQQAAELAALGVQVASGTAVFTDPRTITLTAAAGQQTLTADAFIVASGSVPIFPPAMKPNGKTILAPRFASALDSLPDSVVVVGAGVTGVEFAYLFNRLGLEVTWIIDQFGVLPAFDADTAQALKETLAQRGVKLVEGYMADHIDQTEAGVEVVTTDNGRYPAALAFLAIGRKPDTANLNLEAAGLSLDSGVAAVDVYGRSAQPHIYLVGDVTGAPMIANRGMAQARVAGLHAAGLDPAPFREDTVIAAVYSEPQVAQIGRLNGVGVCTVQTPYTATLKGHLLPQEKAFLKLAYDEKNGRIMGATAVGPHAADALAPVAIALQANLTVSDLMALYGAHPTVSELAFIAARQASILG
ncbi:MAG: NAD(P)/FAD-dependent oxidoreductase, partial [Anaerolineales bacterium]|nr:NAD(P)/FAD-dependent oxidoreductase [Anaerolineales bacterium]